MKKRKFDGEILCRVDGISERDFSVASLILTDKCLYFKKADELIRFEHEDIIKASADSSRLYVNLRVGNLSIWATSDNNNLSEMEDELMRTVRKVEIDQMSQLHGAAKRQEKKYKKSYTKQIIFASIIVSFIAVGATMLYALISQNIK